MANVLKAAMWPAIVWVIIDILLKVAFTIDPTAGEAFPNYLVDPWTIGITLALALWAGAAIKRAKGQLYEALAGGVLVGLACGVPTLLLFGGSTGFIIDIVLFSFAVAWGGWGLREAFAG